MARYIFITGGVVSSLGKGIAAASLASLFKLRGFKVSLQKLDPYINLDPGTMSPFQHGEVLVTEDGAETDLDLGHYERNLNSKLSHKNNFTAACSKIIFMRHFRVQISFIMPKIKIGFRTIFCNKNLAMLKRTHCARIKVYVWIKFHHCNF